MTPVVLVAIPAVEWIYTQAVAALLELRLPPGSRIVFGPGASSIAQKRTKLAEQSFTGGEFTHLLFLDSDQVPPPDAVERLLSHELDIVGGLYFMRHPPHVACAWLPNADDHAETVSQLGGVQRVNVVGTGCLLITLSALLRIQRPWFAHPDPNEPGAYEDTHFCAQAKKAGIPVHVDTGLVIGHIGATSVDRDYVAAWAATPQAQTMPFLRIRLSLPAGYPDVRVPDR